MNQIWHKIRRFGLEIYCFLTAPFVLKNCLGMVTFMAALLFLSTWWMKCYTHHGESIEVPDFANMNMREATRLAHSRNFEIAITDSIYVEGKAPGTILSQNPKPKSFVKEGRRIYFTIVKNTADLVTLPSLVGNDDYDLYNRQCARLNVRTRILSRVPDARLEPNTIVAVMYRSDTITNLLRSGYKVEMGATLDIVVTEAANNMIAVPSCTCMTLDAAKFLITSSNLNVGQITKDASVTNPATAYVWKQMPSDTDGSTVPLGSTIDLFITQESPAGCQ
jgi:beta-lactam-binding protein with PASTA domain